MSQLAFRSVFVFWTVAVIAAITLLLLPWSGKAQRSGEPRFEQLSVEHGLSQGLVKAIVQDKNGYLWFGTADGLNRYDGYNFLVYRPGGKDAPGLGNGRIVALAIDSANTLWIGTDDGLFSRDPRSGHFTRHSTRIESNVPHYRDGISALHVDNTGRIWVATHGSGLQRYTPQTGSWRYYRQQAGKTGGIGSNDIHAIVPSGSRYLWLAAYGAGITLFDMTTGNGKLIRPMLRNETDTLVTTMVSEGDSAMWVGTTAGNILRMSFSSMQWQDMLAAHKHTRIRPIPRINIMICDRDCRIWCGSEADGMILFDQRNDVVYRFLQKAGYLIGLGTDGIRALYQDQSGVIWIGSNGRGISYTAPSIRPFGLIREAANYAYSLSFERVNAIYVDSLHRVWLGGDGTLNTADEYGRLRLAARLGRSSGRSAVPKNVRKRIFSIHPFPGNPKLLLLGTEGDGVCTFNMKTGSIHRLRTRGQSAIEGKIVTKIREMRDGNLWVGTEAGLSILNPTTKTAKSIPLTSIQSESGSTDIVRDFLQDRRGWVFIGFDRSGIMLIDPAFEHGTMMSHDPMDSTSLPSNTVYCIHEDKTGTIWAGTEHGLARYDAAKGTFTSFTTRDGLPNNVIYGILEGDDGQLWLSTNFGLVRFHPKKGVMTTYNAGDGLQGNEFNPFAFYRSTDGEMYFGGVNGVSYFHPAKIRPNEYLPPIVVTSCRIGDNTLDYQISEGDTLVVSATENQAYLSFAALNFVRSEENRYRYRIDGLHSDWQHLGFSRDLSLIGLPLGFYSLQVQAANNDGVWNADGLLLYLDIRPAFHETVWFRILGVLLLAVVIYTIFRLRIASHRSQEYKLELLIDERTARLEHINAQLLREIEQRRRAEEEAYRANAVKSEFLAHMSHEIRTPMNAILGFTEILQTKITDKANLEFLDSIVISGNTLLQLINDILDLSRIEAGRVELVYKPTNIRNLVREVQRIFEWKLKQRNIVFINKIDKSLPEEVIIDDVRLRQILLNLIGNAVKFTERGSITIQVVVLQRKNTTCTIEFTVIDTGPGIPPAMIDKIFEPFHQGLNIRDTQNSGTGLGLAIAQRFVNMMQGHISVRSEMGRGSAFKVVFPDIASSTPYSGKHTTTETEQDVLPVQIENLAKREDYADAAACQTLLEVIEQKHYDTWDKIRKRFVLQEIEKFGTTIHELGKKTGCHFFDEWTNALLDEVDNFDMDNLPYTLQRFEMEFHRLQELLARPK